MFPKITYDWEEFCEWEVYHEWKCEEEMEMVGFYSSRDKGCIWLKKPSITTLLHEFMHHIGYKLNLPHIWHQIIERIL